MAARPNSVLRNPSNSICAKKKTSTRLPNAAVIDCHSSKFSNRMAILLRHVHKNWKKKKIN